MRQLILQPKIKVICGGRALGTKYRAQRYPKIIRHSCRRCGESRHYSSRGAGRSRKWVTQRVRNRKIVNLSGGAGATKGEKDRIPVSVKAGGSPLCTG